MCYVTRAVQDIGTEAKLPGEVQALVSGLGCVLWKKDRVCAVGVQHLKSQHEDRAMHTLRLREESYHISRKPAGIRHTSHNWDAIKNIVSIHEVSHVFITSRSNELMGKNPARHK